ncbi:aldolase/citrate lyase family protein [Acidobacteria bacterium AH-259-G07]|nr:aldolase/citrate lyase family protein [Acidobacteria bacterium AH-259-G07]
MDSKITFSFVTVTCLLLTGIQGRAHDPKSDPSFRHFNKVIEKLERGALVNGMYVSSLDPSNALGLVNSNGWQVGEEIYTRPAIDFLFIEMEHEPFNLEKLRSFLLTLFSRREVFLKGNLQPNIVPIVLLPAAASQAFHTYIKQVLDLGVFGVKLPMVQNADQARRFVKACRYPQPTASPISRPRGTRGVYPVWASYLWGLTQREYIERADVWPLNPHGDLMALVHIEDHQGVENVDAILDVPGITAVTFGPLDYSFSIGRPNDTTHPQVQAAFRKVKDACDRRDIPLIVWADETNIQQRIDQGYKMLVIGTDTDNDLGESPRWGNRGAGKVLDYLRQRK